MKLTTDLQTNQVVDSAIAGSYRRLGLADALKKRTAELHHQAERSGIIGAMIRGSEAAELGRGSYALFLRNLLPAYRELELGLQRYQHQPGISGLCRNEVFRTGAIESDLAHLVGDGWEAELPLLPSGSRYAGRVAAAAHGDGARLIAHAYTRYLGDLAGGQILKRRLMARVGGDAACLSFYDFPQITDPAWFAREYRQAIDAAGAELSDLEPVEEEAAVAFLLNIDLSKAVYAWAQKRS